MGKMPPSRDPTMFAWLAWKACNATPSSACMTPETVRGTATGEVSENVRMLMPMTRTYMAGEKERKSRAIAMLTRLYVLIITWDDVSTDTTSCAVSEFSTSYHD